MKNICRFLIGGGITCIVLQLIILSGECNQQKTMSEISESLGRIEIILESNNETKGELTDTEETSNKLPEETQGLPNELPEDTERSDTEQATDAKQLTDKETKKDAIIQMEDEEKVKISDMAVDMYLSGEWDGKPTILKAQEISICENGRLLVNGYLSNTSKFHSQHCIDIPASMRDDQEHVFILGDGTYRIENNRLTKYHRGKKVALSGGTLDWTGMDLENYRPFDVYFYYDKVHDKLFLIASSVPYDMSSKELKDNVGVYLYIVPDRSESKIQFISQITGIAIDESGLFYEDTSGTIWRFTESDGKYSVKKSNNPDLKDKLPAYEWIEEGEIHFDWRCTFADGYIDKRDEFPEGTFTHQVITTPSVPLSEYE